MMSQTSDAIRAKVDALFAAAQHDVEIQQQLETNPGAFLASQGLYEIAEPTEDRGHSIHMCPWHTCQGTRHHETAVQ